jgi:tRNA(Ile)-lysidine synthase
MKNEIADSVLERMAGFDLPAGGSLVVAFSGGPDSLCLLEVLAGLVRSGRLDLHLSACHVDHRLRPCSGSDAGFARRFAESLGVGFELLSEDVGEVAAREGRCIEDAARRVRYRLLEEAARSQDARFVATGHNLDDQAETVLMRILRGTGISGLSGIKPSRPITAGSDVTLVRPLIDVGRERILAYLDGRKLGYLTDETNADTSYLRNRVRAHLLPLIEENYSPAVRTTLARLAQSAREASEVLETIVNEAYSAALLDKSDKSIKLKLESIRTSADYMLYGIVKKAFESLGFAGVLTAAKSSRIAQAVREGRTSGRFTPGAGASVEFHDDKLLVTRSAFPGPPAEWEAELQVPGVTHIERLNGAVYAEIVDRRDFDLDAFRNTKSSLEEALDAGAVSSALTIRSVRPGERFQPLGLDGTKKVSDFLIDLKVPLREKGREAVLCAGGKVAWLVGRRLDGRFAVTGNSKRVLLLCLFPGEGD